MRAPRYGELQVTDNFEAYLLWRQRDEEPELCPPADPCDDDAHACPSATAFARELLRMIDAALTEREKAVLLAHHVLGRSFAETALEFGVTPKRVQQIEAKALRKARSAVTNELWRSLSWEAWLFGTH